MLNLAAGSLRFVKRPTPDPRDATIKKLPGWLRDEHVAYSLGFGVVEARLQGNRASLREWLLHKTHIKDPSSLT